MNDKETVSKDILKAFREYDRQATIANFKVACVIGIVLMPAGAILDSFIYPDKVWKFLELRLLCSLAIGGFLFALLSPFGRKHYRYFGIVLFMLPATAIAWMIYATEGAISPYYAGLNLVLLVLALILHWTFWETLIVTLLIIALYSIASFAHGKISHETIPIIVNNLYFLFLTGIITATGSYFHNKIRFREFAFRHQLDKSKRELEETNRKLVELDRLKGKFFANISHEMRTPLTLLLAPLESLRQRYAQSLDPAAREMLTTMHANGMRLLKLINDLLELIRVESGRMDIRRDTLVLADFFKGLASAVRQVAETKQIRLETDLDAALGTAVADRDKLEKIVLNLLFNAVKFTPAGGKVVLRARKQISQAEPGREELVIAVSDTGVGIAREHLPFVFDRFWQGDNSAKRKFSGVGIGLALVKELTEILNGRVVVESEEGRGATFTVWLPYQKADRSDASPSVPDGRQTAIAGKEGAVASEEWLANLYRRAELFPAVAVARGGVRAPDAGGGRPLVLIAEDEPDMQRYLKTELQRDYDLIQAWDGLQALEKAQDAVPDLILLDMMMPEMDGLEVCRELRRREATANIPVILLTARADEETKYDALKIGANDFLAKPFSATELQARIRNLIESHHYQRKLSRQNAALTSAIEQIKETEMQLVQSEKLASLGRLSAGIIHEINNPLNYALTGLFALRHKSKLLAPEQRGEYEEILNDIEEGIKRVRNIVTDLRTFTHPGGAAAETVVLGEAVEAALRFLAGEWKDKIRIERHLPPDQTVWANRNQLIHVLVNLLQNSIDALAEKKFPDGQQPTIWIQGRVEGDRSLVIVRDNGPGIDPKNLDKIFDPFFTTKEVGKGMGLGLSICYRIVQRYAGKILVRSERGKFCEFAVELPVNKPVAEVPRQETLALK